jgi:hypothetical protein
MAGSAIFWKMKSDGGCRVTMWNFDSGAVPSNVGGVWTMRKTWFSSQVMDETILNISMLQWL